MKNSPNISSEEFWLNHIKQIGKSGLSRIEYCKKHGLSHKALSNFVYYRRKQGITENSPPRAPEFIKKSLPTPTKEERTVSSKIEFVKAIIDDRRSKEPSLPAPQIPNIIRLKIGSEFTIEFNNDTDPSWVACFISSMRS